MSLEFTEQELAAMRAEYCKGATDTQFDLFISECKARNLRPGVHLVFQLRNSKEYDPSVGASVFVKKPYWITTIAALRLIAQRTGEYLGQGPDEFVYLDDAGLPTIKSDIPLPVSKTDPTPREPWVARAKVYRKGFAEPMIGMARFEAYAGTRKIDKNSNEVVLTDMWLKRGSEQLQKCAEALALRKAFAEEMSGLMILEELKEVEEHTAPAAVTPASVVPLPPSPPKVDQTPAVGKNEPRPGENVVSFPKLGTPAGPIATVLAEGVVIDKHLGPVPPVDPKLAEALAAVPSLKPASELPAPKKRGRQAKPKSPDNGIPPVEGISDADIALAGTPAPVDTTDPKVAQEFVESVTSFTSEEAAAQGLPEPPDPIPSKEEGAAFVARARKLVEPGVDIKSVGDYTLKLGDKTSSKYLTVGDWTKALTNLEAAKAAGTLKELVKGKEVPLGEFQ
jgi:phage recombination protein Bet